MIYYCRGQACAVSSQTLSDACLWFPNQIIFLAPAIKPRETIRLVQFLPVANDKLRGIGLGLDPVLIFPLTLCII